jgi:hypothetical protein
METCHDHEIFIDQCKLDENILSFLLMMRNYLKKGLKVVSKNSRSILDLDVGAAQSLIGSMVKVRFEIPAQRMIVKTAVIPITVRGRLEQNIPHLDVKILNFKIIFTMELPIL